MHLPGQQAKQMFPQPCWHCAIAKSVPRQQEANTCWQHLLALCHCHAKTSRGADDRKARCKASKFMKRHTPAGTVPLPKTSRGADDKARCEASKFMKRHRAPYRQPACIEPTTSHRTCTSKPLLGAPQRPAQTSSLSRPLSLSFSELELPFLD